MAKATIRSESGHFAWIVQTYTNRKGDRTLRFSVADIIKEKIDNERFILSVPVKRARRFAQWILDNTEES